jgi:hypothetical protein
VRKEVRAMLPLREVDTAFQRMRKRKRRQRKRMTRKKEKLTRKMQALV